MNYLSVQMMSKWSWIVQWNGPETVKWAISSQHNKIESRIVMVVAFVKIYW